MILFDFDSKEGYQIQDDTGYRYFCTWDYAEAVAEFVKRAMEWIKENPNG